METARTLTQASGLPHDIQAEKSLCGALIMDPTYINRCAEIVNSSDFWHKPHAIIFDHLARMAYEHEKIDLVTLVDRLVVSHKLEEVGGRAYLVEVQEDIYSAANSQRYAEIIKEKAQLRNLYKLGMAISTKAVNQSEPNDLASYTIAQAMAIGGEAGIRSVLLSDRAVEILKPAEGLTTGFAPLDERIVCLENGSLNIFAGFTGMGKSTFVSGILQHVTQQLCVRAALVDLEMTDKQRGHRTMAAVTGIDMQRIRRWESLTPSEVERCEMALAKDVTEYVFRDEIKMMEIYRFLDREVPLGLRLLAVDYLQLVDADFRQQRRDQEVGYVSRGLKKCAKHFNIPIIAVSQFSKPKEEIDPQGKRKKGARPHLGLMRESGRIAEDADVVIFVHRTTLMDGELIIAKNRQGSKCLIKTTFVPDTAQFVERFGGE